MTTCQIELHVGIYLSSDLMFQKNVLEPSKVIFTFRPGAVKAATVEYEQGENVLSLMPHK